MRDKRLCTEQCSFISRRDCYEMWIKRFGNNGIVYIRRLCSLELLYKQTLTRSISSNHIHTHSTRSIHTNEQITQTIHPIYEINP
jgi:hypothetical protein